MENDRLVYLAFGILMNLTIVKFRPDDATAVDKMGLIPTGVL